MKMAWMFGSGNSKNYPVYLHVGSLHKLWWVLLIVCIYFSHANPTVCSTDSNISLAERLRRSEEVIRGKLLRVEDSQTLVVRVINVYKGDNATEGRNIIIKIFSNFGITDDLSTCMISATERLKYIFFLKKQSPISNNVFYLQYDGILATRDVSRNVRQIVEDQAYECFDCVSTTVTMETHSDAGHYAECSEWHQEHYCQNGGTCTYIVALEQHSCECPSSYTGHRCQFYNIAAVGNDRGDNNIAPIALGCTFAFVFIVCLAVAALYIWSRRKNLRASTEQGEEGEVEVLTDVVAEGDQNQNTERKPGHDLTVPSIQVSSDDASDKGDYSRLMGETLDSSTNSTLVSSGSIHRKESTV